MSTPVRSVVLEKFRGVLQTQLPEIKTIKFFQVVPTDVLHLELPALYLFEVGPENRWHQNRVASGTMHLMIQIFFKITMQDGVEYSFSDAYTTMDELAGKLHTCYHNTVGLSKNGLVNITELQYDRIITGEQVGMLNSTFDVEYRHDRGNAFS